MAGGWLLWILITGLAAGRMPWSRLTTPHLLPRQAVVRATLQAAVRYAWAQLSADPHWTAQHATQGPGLSEGQGHVQGRVQTDRGEGVFEIRFAEASFRQNPYVSVNNLLSSVPREVPVAAGPVEPSSPRPFQAAPHTAVIVVEARASDDDTFCQVLTAFIRPQTPPGFEAVLAAHGEAQVDVTPGPLRLRSRAATPPLVRCEGGLRVVGGELDGRRSQILVLPGKLEARLGPEITLLPWKAPEPVASPPAPPDSPQAVRLRPGEYRLSADGAVSYRARAELPWQKLSQLPENVRILPGPALLLEGPVSIDGDFTLTGGALAVRPQTRLSCAGNVALDEGLQGEGAVLRAGGDLRLSGLGAPLPAPPQMLSVSCGGRLSLATRPGHGLSLQGALVSGRELQVEAGRELEIRGCLVSGGEVRLRGGPITLTYDPLAAVSLTGLRGLPLSVSTSLAPEWHP